MTSKAYFSSVDDMATFCAGLTRENISYTVQPGNGAGQYVVTIEQDEAK